MAPGAKDATGKNATPRASRAKASGRGGDAAGGRTGDAAGRRARETESLLALIDKLGSLLEKSDLVELEVEAGETGILLRKPSAFGPPPGHAPATDHSAAAALQAVMSVPAEPGSGAAESSLSGPAVKVVRAPLTGVFYAASSPTAPPYVTAGQQVSVGQIIGLIEAMKLFNEIKSDVAGKVVRVVAESGKLVKAKSPLIEVEP